MAKMSSRERVMASFAHEEPDRVPAWLGAAPETRLMLIQHLALSSDEALSVHLGDDFRRVFASYAGPREYHPFLDLHEGSTMRTPFGIERQGYGYGMPRNSPLKEATLADVHEYPWPDPAWIDPCGISDQAQSWQGQYAILGGDWSPFWHDAIDLLDWENLFLKMYDEPDVVDAVMQHLVDYYVGTSQRIFDAAANDIDIFFIGNDFGTQNGPMISVEMFKRFVMPHLKRLIDLGHDYGLKVMMHCCGGFEPLIPLLIEAELDGLQALQPSARGMDPSDLKAKYGEHMVFTGCIDSQHVLIEGSPDYVRASTRKILDIMKPTGGFIASPSHDYLLPETPIENILAMYETVQEYGRY